jgi:glycosyltransferase involved in cell wall biosynthesis
LRGEAAVEARGEVTRLLYVGRLAEDKGVMTALRALAAVDGRFAGSLSIYGRGTPEYEAKLRAYAQEHQLPVRIAAAAAEQMPRVYQSHDLLLFTSEWEEPFALTPLEAMACGLPVIGTMTGGSAELFRHGENALTYTAGHHQELAERIAEFAGGAALRIRCARTAHLEARQRFAAPVIVDQIEAYLGETLKTWPRSQLRAHL